MKKKSKTTSIQWHVAHVESSCWSQQLFMKHHNVFLISENLDYVRQEHNSEGLFPADPVEPGLVLPDGHDHLVERRTLHPHSRSSPSCNQVSSCQAFCFSEQLLSLSPTLRSLLLNHGSHCGQEEEFTLLLPDCSKDEVAVKRRKI